MEKSAVTNVCFFLQKEMQYYTTTWSFSPDENKKEENTTKRNQTMDLFIDSQGLSSLTLPTPEIHTAYLQ